MASVSGTIGGQPVVLDNAASEATLKAILAALKGNQSSLDKLAAAGGGAGGGGGGSSSGGGGGMGGAAKGASTALGMLGKVAGVGAGGAAAVLGGMVKGLSLFATGITGLIGTVAEAVGALAGLAKQAFDGDLRMSQFFDAFKDLPVIGVVAGLFSQLAKIQEANLDAYRSLTKVGINFGGALTDVRTAALNMGMSLDQFVGAMKNNQDVFVGLGGTVDGGAQQFVKFSKALRDSKAGDQLMALGMSSEEMANSVGNFIRVNGGLTAKQKGDYEGVAKAAADYAKQTDVLSKLTGQSAEELEKKMAKEANDAAWEAQLQGMDEESRKKANEAMKVAMATGGQGAVDALKARMMGLPPMTEAGQAFVARMGSANKQLDVMEKSIKDGTTADQARSKIQNAGADMQVDLAKNAKAQGIQTLQALANSGDETAKAQLRAYSTMEKAGVDTYEGNRKRLAEAEKQQKEQFNSQAAMAARAEKQLKDLGQLMNAFLEPILKVFTPIMTDVIKTFTDFVNGPGGREGMRQLGNQIAGLVKTIMEYTKNLLSPEGRDKIVNDLKYGFKLMMAELKRAILPSWLYSDKDLEQDKKALAEEKAVYDQKAAIATADLDNRGKMAAAELALNDKAKAIKQEKLNADKKELEEIRKKGDKASPQEALKAVQLAQQVADAEELLKQASAMTKEQANAVKTGNAQATAQIKDVEKNKGKKPEVVSQDNGRVDANGNSFSGGTADAGNILRDFGSGTPAMLHGKEAVLTEQQMKNLAMGQGGSGGNNNQEALLGALQTLNKQTAQLVAINAQAAEYNKRLVEKFEWAGNLFS
jgi:hypothetical protein